MLRLKSDRIVRRRLARAAVLHQPVVSQNERGVLVPTHGQLHRLADESRVDSCLLDRLTKRNAALPLEMQEAIAAPSPRTLKASIRAHRQVSATPPLPAGTFRVIYADPPWKYGSETHGASASRHYPTMDIADLCAMDIKSVAADDAVLFLWTTSPFLYKCAPVIKAWGFAYKTHIVWDKVRGVCGSYVDVRHEILLICTRGSCTPDRLTPAIDSVQTIEKSRVHSQKPDACYTIIERLYDGPYLELFARRLRKGWSSFGNDPALQRAGVPRDTTRRAVLSTAGEVDLCAR